MRLSTSIRLVCGQTYVRRLGACRGRDFGPGARAGGRIGEGVPLVGPRLDHSQRSLPVLYADDRGFHTGNIWYRGHFPAGGKETGIHLVSDSSGGAQAFSAWLNGHFLGSSTTRSADCTFPSGAPHRSGDNVISMLTVDMGHGEDYGSTNANKAARGLTMAALTGSPGTRVA